MCAANALAATWSIEIPAWIPLPVAAAMSSLGGTPVRNRVLARAWTVSPAFLATLKPPITTS